MLTSSAAGETRHKVLLVDDDAVSLELMAMLLAHEGHKVLRANDAGAALEMLEAEKPARPDVLLVDLQMPGVSGGQLAERVRALGDADRRPLLLAMSATEAQRKQLLAFDGFLLKPLELGELRQALNHKKQKRKPAVRAAHNGKPTGRSSRQEVPVFDMTVVEKLLAMMPVESLENVIAACIADARACIASLQNQPAPWNEKSAIETAHRIKGAAAMVGATRLASLAAGIETGGYTEADTRSVLKELLSACIEVEGMLLEANFRKIRAPHHEPTDRNNTGNT